MEPNVWFKVNEPNVRTFDNRTLFRSVCQTERSVFGALLYFEGVPYQDTSKIDFLL